MMRSRWAVSLAAVLVPAAILAGLVLSLNYETVVVEYTASLDGNLDGCECWGDPVAGLVKRAVRYRPTRGRAPERPDLLLDTGNILPPGTEPELSRHILETYRELGYDLVAPGDQELSDGTDAFRRYLTEYPLGSHNLSLPVAAPLEKPVYRNVGAATVAVLSLTGEESFAAYPQEFREQFTLVDPLPVARRLIGSSSGATHRIVLYHGDRNGAERVANGLSGVDAVIYGRGGELNEELLANGTLLLSPGRHGNRVGRLTLRSRRSLFSPGRVSLRARNSFLFFDYFQDPDDPLVRERIAAYEKMREAAVAAAYGERDPSSEKDEALQLFYYYSPGCKECREFLRERAPAIVSSLPFPVKLRRRNILNPAVFEEFESLLGRTTGESDEFPLALVGERILQGSEEIDAGLEELLLSHDSGEEPRVGELLSPAAPEEPPVAYLERGERLSLLPVMAAGLLDGINPCVFTALIFLTSSLLLLRKQRRELILLGALFVATVYVTYFLVGLGLFAGLRAVEGLSMVARGFRYVLAAALVVLALLSLRDAWLARNGETGRMGLRLPKSVARRIHSEIRGYRRRGAMIGGTITLAVVITLFELGCTGQIYLPTLAYYARSSARSFSLLAVYNLTFVLPLIAVFVAVVAGVGTTRIQKLFLTGLPSVKLASALLFFGFAAAILFM